MTSVIVPAHNEERVIGRLLDGLLGEADDGEFEVIVVSNGSTDRTAVAAARPGVRVIELVEASKHLALLAGDQAASEFPRLYVDADVVLDTASARALVAELSEPGILAAAPTRVDRLDLSTRGVRAYYRVWNQLSAVRQSLAGRGVVGVTAQGYERIAQRPSVLGDDLFVSSRFCVEERRIVTSASSVVFAPRTLRALLRRRVRAAQGNTELASTTRGRTNTTRTSAHEVSRLALTSPRQLPSVVVFVLVTLAARLGAARARARRSDSWLRDDSSRG